MLDLSQNVVIAAVVGPLTVFLLTFVGWALRRLYLKHDEEIKNMAVTQKEFDERLLNVLVLQSRFDERLDAGFDRIGSDIAGLRSELREHRAAMDKEIAVLRERIGDNGSRNGKG